MSVQTSPDLDRRYLELVDKLAASSKDRSTGIGAILITGDGAHIQDCNRLPEGIEDTDPRSERPAKYLYWEHAERNVIYHAANIGARTKAGVLYTTGIPCADCARAVIQAGIWSVVVWKRGSGLEATDRWYESIKAGREMLEEAGIDIVEVDHD